MATPGDVVVPVKVTYTQERIRVSKEGAELVLRLLMNEESRIQQVRRDLKTLGETRTEVDLGPTIGILDQSLARVRRVRRETERVLGAWD